MQPHWHTSADNLAIAAGFVIVTLFAWNTAAALMMKRGGRVAAVGESMHNVTH